MSFNTFGHALRVTTWGESHGPAIGCVVDGCPPGLEIDEAFIQQFLDQRKPGQNRFTTQRKEPDEVRIYSGVFEGRSTGTPISLIIYNQDQRSKDYGEIKESFRPGHADYTYFKKYGIRDYRGGGRSSARETAMRVAAGAVARKIIAAQYPHLHIRAALVSMGSEAIDYQKWDWNETQHNPFFTPDASAVGRFSEYLDKIRKAGSSVGAVIECIASNVPVGLGAPVYAKLDTELAAAMMSINAVKGVEIGNGFEAARIRGEENADPMRIDKNTGEPVFLSNNAGGILGGISSGQDLVVRFAIKPTSSILQEVETINKNGEETSIKTKGRHDPCVGIRAVPVAEAMMACVLADQLLMHQGQCNTSS